MIEEEQKRRRETPAEVVARKAARQLVAPLLDRIGEWQLAAAKLEVMALRPVRPGQGQSEAGEKAREVLAAVQAEAAAFEARLEAVPEDVRTHSRVTDARKVLGMLIARFERLISD